MEKSVQEFQKNVLQLGLDIIREQFESIDERIKISEKRKKKWSVVKSDPKTLVTSIGEFTTDHPLYTSHGRPLFTEKLTYSHYLKTKE